MPRTIEQGGNALTTWLGNATALPTEWIRPLFALALGYRIAGRWRLGHLDLGREETVSLFYNAVLYVRVALPFWIGLQVRWAGRDPTKREYLQAGIGWKLNGRLAVLLRIQSDRTAAAGSSGPNTGQATGWDYGTK